MAQDDVYNGAYKNDDAHISWRHGRIWLPAEESRTEAPEGAAPPRGGTRATGTNHQTVGRTFFHTLWNLIVLVNIKEYLVSID